MYEHGSWSTWTITDLRLYLFYVQVIIVINEDAILFMKNVFVFKYCKLNTKLKIQWINEVLFFFIVLLVFECLWMRLDNYIYVYQLRECFEYMSM